jgi:hypothetical protein
MATKQAQLDELQRLRIGWRRFLCLPDLPRCLLLELFPFGQRFQGALLMTFFRFWVTVTQMMAGNSAGTVL